MKIDTSYANSLKYIPPLEKKEQEKMFKEYYRTRCPRLEKKLWESNLRLVPYLLAKKGFHRPDDDLFQEANLMLLNAVKKFDPNRGLTFSAYAVWWILAGAMKHMDITYSRGMTGARDKDASWKSTEDILGLQDGRDFHDIAQDNLERQELDAMVKELQPREQEILSRRMRGDKLQAIAKDEKCSRERVRQIDIRAQKKLKKMFEQKAA